jgi:WD40 repeat protein
MPDRVGQQIGNYRLVKLLGKGGFAEVYLGQHMRLASKQAAIKILHLFDVDIRKFQEEAETTERLVHPHIVRLLDFDIEQGTPFLVLDFAPGGSLRARHPKGSVVPLATVGKYLKELAPALQHAHDKHILHRDIKPDNILIGRQGELLLSDFGIAVLSQTGRTSLEASYGIGGTPYYMAPEAYVGKQEKASDQYALAVVVYEWLCGSVPFSQGNFIQLGYQHAHEPVPPLRERNPAIPPEVEAVIMKALSKGPKERFASVQEFATALDQASQQHPIVVRQPIIQQQPVLSPSDKPPGTTLEICRGHSEAVLSVGWSPDGRYIVSGGEDRTAQVWEANTGRRIIAYKGHSVWLRSVGWSPDGRYIVSGGGDGAQVWEANTGNRITNYGGHNVMVTSVAWSPDGKYIVSGGDDNTAQVWEANTGKRITSFNPYTDLVTSVAWSPDGKYIVSGGDGPTVKVWEVATGNLITEYTGINGWVNIAWSPDGKYIVTGDYHIRVHVWEANTGKRITNYEGHKYGVSSAVWSPDGKYIVSGGDDGAQVWEAATGRRIINYTEHSGRVLSVAWSPDGKKIATGSSDKTVRVWVAPK